LFWAKRRREGRHSRCMSLQLNLLRLLQLKRRLPSILHRTHRPWTTRRDLLLAEQSRWRSMTTRSHYSHCRPRGLDLVKRKQRHCFESTASRLSLRYQRKWTRMPVGWRDLFGYGYTGHVTLATLSSEQARCAAAADIDDAMTVPDNPRRRSRKCSITLEECNKSNPPAHQPDLRLDRVLPSSSRILKSLRRQHQTTCLSQWPWNLEVKRSLTQRMISRPIHCCTYSSSAQWPA
jgi:hypothetical protein